MNQQGHNDRLASLADRPDLPVRVHGALVGLQKRTGAYFGHAIERTIDELERELFKIAEQSGSNTAQQTCFEGLRKIKLGRAGVVPLFLQHTEAQLAQLRQPAQIEAAPAERSAVNTPRNLELVGVAAQDEELALNEAAGKAEVRNSQGLYAFARRVAVLGAAPVWPNDSLPLGPLSLVRAFGEALKRLDLELEQRILAYRVFDRSAMLGVGPFYEELNAYLIAQRILKHLNPEVMSRRSGASDAQREESAMDAATEAAATPAAEAPPTTHPTRPTGPPRSVAPPRPPAPAKRTSEDPELFHTLRDLLGERRRREGEREPRSFGDTAQASSADLQAVLGMLQHTRPRGASPHYDSEHFKNTLQVKLRHSGPLGQPLTLGGEDSDTIDLIGMLFGYINENMQEDTAARGLLNKLHVPMMRVALSDKTFFTRRDHPARELLNTIGETAARWADDSDSDPELVRKMELVVDHVARDFDGDIGVFESLLNDLSAHMQQIARRADVVERRHIDAAKGRDRLDIARAAARKAIAQIIQASSPLPLVRSLLEDAWVDSLALSALREGEDGAEFKHRAGIAKTLSTFTAESIASTPSNTSLRTDLDTGLRQVGLHENDVNGLLDKLLPKAGETEQITPESLQQIGSVLKGKARLGGVDGTPEPAADTPPAAPLNAEERKMLAHLHKIPFGSWFDFVTNQQGHLVRRKLAWFSTVTGRCLFVNQRGARTADITLEHLARDLVRGQAKLAGTERVSLIDRAWKAITDALRPSAGAELVVAE